ncbi:hypothetical protein BDP81DRAFT_424481 [Colletotrichum phormii]|uniref:Secreted protein n=1 Tax=Colletotrichum phormii TaxID=359342 RepID=A0AAJ0EFI2_9PEZI|nr:uncharacterized protein BDP81DRAFT_424481 [Colletotrichum phormii]KAK1638227.1 hypothetical protein BDP81DRAFT_424481 [Colletotrichum phormii]
MPVNTVHWHCALILSLSSGTLRARDPSILENRKPGGSGCYGLGRSRERDTAVRTYKTDLQNHDPIMLDLEFLMPARLTRPLKRIGFDNQSTDHLRGTHRIRMTMQLSTTRAHVMACGEPSFAFQTSCSVSFSLC